MAEVYKIIHPEKYFNDYIIRDCRTDGRKFDELRDIKLNVNAIKSTDASAIVKCGNTTVLCGIKLELAKPKAEESDLGFVVTNVELLSLCAPKFRPGPPSDQAQVFSNIVSDIFINSKCVNLKDLCIVPNKLAWVLYCDMVCLDYDGGVIDACIITLMTSLMTLTLPMVIYNAETEEIMVDTSVRAPLTITGLPVTSSFSIYQQTPRSLVLADPSAYEEEMCGGVGANLIICCNDEQICGIQKFGGGTFSTEAQNKTLAAAKEKCKLVQEVIETCIKNEI